MKSVLSAIGLLLLGIFVVTGMTVLASGVAFVPALAASTMLALVLVGVALLLVPRRTRFDPGRKRTPAI